MGFRRVMYICGGIKTKGGGKETDGKLMTDNEMDVVKNPALSRKAMLLRLDPAVHRALAEWAEEDSRSLNSHIELLLRDDLAVASRLPSNVQPLRRPGRPPLATYK